MGRSVRGEYRLPSAFLANPILCCAAVLLVPQALECCSTHPQTLLEGLSQSVEAHRHPPAHDHAADEQRERLCEKIDRIVTGSGADPVERSQDLSLPAGHGMSEPPAVAAGDLAGVRVVIRQRDRGRSADHTQPLAGRVVQPATPPPRPTA
jgi:hypothetical protein